ncbi:MAG: class I SAM-dependent methyltransferase [Tissierellaceae bacterium]|nr:class I SAM-dependent methyltransferase [Tissierellaceae bacterium]
MYDNFAYLYDELMNDFDYEKWFEYIQEIFIKYNKKPVNILEMACGTGSLSYYIGKEGYKLTCFDLSEEMLSIAYDKLKRYKNIKILRQDMTNFNVNKKFDSVISICDSINYILDKKDLLKTFTNVYNHLNDDGMFIFDINSYYKLKEVIGNNTFVEDRDNIFYTWQNFYDDESDICDFFLTFFYAEDGDNFIRFDEEHQEKAYKTEEIEILLKEVGFKSVDVYDAFTFDSPGKRSERINYVATK